MSDEAAAGKYLTTVRKACDRCHARKVKCDGTASCARCVRAGAECTFLNPVLPKGPKPACFPPGTESYRRRRRKKRVSSCTAAPALQIEDDSSVRRRQSDSKDGDDDDDVATAGGVSCCDETAIQVSVSAAPIPLLLPVSSQSEACQVVNVGELDSQDSRNGDLISWLALSSDPAMAEAQSGVVTEIDPDEQTLEQTVALNGTVLAQNNSVVVSAARSRWTDDDEPPVLAVTDQNLASILAKSWSMPAQETATTAPSPVMSIKTPATFSSFNDHLAYPRSITNASALPLAAPMFSISPLFEAWVDTLIIPRLQEFYDRVYPMLPIFPPAAIFPHIHSHAHPYPWAADDDRTHNSGFLALVLSMAGLASIHPLRPHELPMRPLRTKQAVALLDEACRLRSSWSHGCKASTEAVLTSYLAFGTLLELRHGDGARFRLREAISLGEAMRLGDADTYLDISNEERRRRLNMFWVLAVTERADALFQSSANITFTSHLLDGHGSSIIASPHASQHLRCLARLFSFLDRDLLTCWSAATMSSPIPPSSSSAAAFNNNNNNNNNNGVNTTLESTLHLMTHERAGALLAALSQPSDVLFSGLAELEELHRADLVVTWQWLRNRIWCLAHRYGLTHLQNNNNGDGNSVNGNSNHDGNSGNTRFPRNGNNVADQQQQQQQQYSWELGPDFPVDVAMTTVELCKSFAFINMEAHGAGFVEKLYDIASTVTGLLRTVPPQFMTGKLAKLAGSPQWSGLLRELHFFVARHRQGSTFARSLSHEVELVSSGSKGGGGGGLTLALGTAPAAAVVGGGVAGVAGVDVGGIGGGYVAMES